MTSRWTAGPACPDHLRGPLERAVRVYLEVYLQDPENGEVFTDVRETEERLLAFSLA